MNVKKTIATIGMTGIVGLTLGMTPAVAAEHSEKPDKGNSVSQAAHSKAKGESNREAAHTHAPGQQKKHVEPAPAPPVEPAPDPVEPPTTSPVADTPADNDEATVPVEVGGGSGDTVETAKT